MDISKNLFKALINCYIMSSAQSQQHGFTWENEIKSNVFCLPTEKNNTDKYDIPCEKNKFNLNENISIKVTGGSGIDCADILRFYSYDFDKENTIVVIEYKQNKHNKRIQTIYEIKYTREMHQKLFGTISLQELTGYVSYIKQIEKGTCPIETTTFYKKEKKRLQMIHGMKINISPKVDSKTQRRVQCSIPKFKETLHEFITERSLLIRGIQISLEINSPSRVRNNKIIN